MLQLKTFVFTLTFSFVIFVNFCLYPAFPRLLSFLNLNNKNKQEATQSNLNGQLLNGSIIECGKSSYQPPIFAQIRRQRQIKVYVSAELIFPIFTRKNQLFRTFLLVKKFLIIKFEAPAMCWININQIYLYYLSKRGFHGIWTNSSIHSDRHTLIYKCNFWRDDKNTHFL